MTVERPPGYANWTREQQDKWYERYGGQAASKDGADTSNGGADGEAALAAIDGEVARLAKLPKAAYDLARRDAAGKLGVRFPILDKLVADARPKGDSPAGQGRPLQLPEPEPWPEPVDGAELLDEIEAVFVRDLPSANPAAGFAMRSLGVAATCSKRSRASRAYANITSPEMRCGKSTLLISVGEWSRKDRSHYRISRRQHCSARSRGSIPDVDHR